MKQHRLLFLLACLLCFLLAGCGGTEKPADKAAGPNGETGAETQAPDPETGGTPAETGEEAGQNAGDSGGPESSRMPSDAEAVSITRYGITLQGVIMTDEYGSASDLAAWMGVEKSTPEDQAYYNLGMVGVWSEEDNMWGYRTLWAYLLPPDGRLTFHVSGDNRHFYLDAYTLEEVEEVVEGSKSWNATGVGGYTSDELEEGDYTLTLDEIKAYFPEFDFLACCVSGNEWIEIFKC